MGALDSIVEEYWRLEDEGRVLVARQCCLHVSGTQHGTAHSGQGSAHACAFKK